MRNLKKTLCLFLALVFVLGLCTVGAADIEFKDEKEIIYKEAVQTMAGLGILKGDDNDRDGKMEFRPKDGLTRAEAAKIIAYVALGPDVEYWPTTQVFDDVPANSHWAAKYIAYCSNRGIINGVGNNKFDPNGKVTLVAVMKMLLAACGYNARGEFTGSGWESAVFDKAFETKVLQGVKATDWYAGATREETAQLAYNTLMNVVQVTFQTSTSSYVPVTINGITNVTIAETVWGIRTDEGVIIANKSNSTTAKGTVLTGTGRIMKYYITDEDSNANLLGHQVRITYRTETRGGTEEAIAYFIEDKCTEVKGTEAARASDAEVVVSFSSGQLVSYTVPGREARATAAGVFVLNADGRVVAYKTEGFFVSVINYNLLTGQATVVDPDTGMYVAVQAPTGVASGDLVTVYHMGDVYTAKACLKQSYVRISQAGPNADRIYTYNDGEIVPSRAAISSLPINITQLVGTYRQLEVGSTYTLWFDAEGGCIGFGDMSGGSSIAAANYCIFDAVRTGTDMWGTESYFAQVILGDGSVQSVPISATTYTAGLVPGAVYKLTNYYNSTQYVLTPAEATEASYEYYTTADPLTDFSNATFILYSGTMGTLTAAPTTKRPALNSAVTIVYSMERAGTVSVRKVKSVWFQTPASSVVPVSNNFIYIASMLPRDERMIGTNVVAYYDGYQNGMPITDLALTAPPSRIGFAYASKNTSTGIYSISYVPDGNGTATGVRTFVLEDGNPSYYITPTALGVADQLNNPRALSLSGVGVVKVGEAALSTLPMNSTAELMNAVANGYGGVKYKVTVTIVETVSGNTHAIGGSTIYVTAITPVAPVTPVS